MRAAIRVLPRIHVFILAGGKGERLSPLTAYRPKPLISFGGIFRIIDFSLLNALNSGLSRISVLTQYRYQDVHDYIRETWGEMSTNLHCLAPGSGKRYRGTADAVFQNLPVLGFDQPEYVLILSGDHIYNMDYRPLIERHAETDADLTIASIECPLREASHFGVIAVDTDFKVAGFQEKPREPRALPTRPSAALISMGVYVFKTSVLSRVLEHHCNRDRGYDFGHDIIPSLVGSERTFAYDFRDEKQGMPRYWRDVGTLDSYYEASLDLVRLQAPFDPYIKDAWRSISLLPKKMGASVAGTAHVAHSVLSPGVRIGEYASVQDCVLMPGAVVGRGARLRGAIVEEGVVMPRGFEAGFDVELDRRRFTVTDNNIVVISGNPTRERQTMQPIERGMGLSATITQM